MTRSAPPAAALALLLAAVLSAPAAGTGLEEALRARDEGRWGDAEALLRKAVAAEDAPPEAGVALARLLEETGRPAEALAAARAAAPRSPSARILLGELLAASGDLAGGERVLRETVAAEPSSAEARTALGDLLRSTGRRKAALDLYVEANDLWAKGVADGPRELMAVVRARFAVMELDPGFRGQMQSTVAILAEPLRAGVPEASVLLAEIYTRHDQTERVPNALRAVLERNPDHPGALLAAARAKVSRFESGEAAALGERVLAVDPVNAGALEMLALLRHGDGDVDGASELVRRGLAVRPADRALLSLDAIPHLLAGREGAFREAVARVLAVDPTYGRAYVLASRVLEDRRRFEEAAAMARRAAEVDPADPEAWFALGRNLLNLGEEEEAREALGKASRADPWRSIFRENFRRVLEELETYATGRTANFEIRIHPGEDAALRPLYEEALERSWADLRARYGFEPEVPILVEVFRDAQDFSARTLGVPGFGAVGACFGKVVTLDSPGALPPGAFCWRSTAHHELAHVFHLQMTRGRVPRWFTEGLSVHEEAVARPSWIRNMDRELVSALANGEVKGLLAIDATFRGPGIQWAYYQGGLMAAWMERDFGWPAVLEMLRLFGRDLEPAAVVREALSLSPAEFDAAFLAWCRRRTASWNVRPLWSDARTAEFRRRSDADAKDLEAHLHLAEACLQRRRTIDAGTALARARALAPEDPFLTELRGLLALQSLKTPETGMALLRQALEAGRDHFDLRMLLASEAERNGKAEEAVEHFRRAKVHFPRAAGPLDPRRELARILPGLGRTEEAVREMEEMAALGESDIDTRMKLATVYEGRGDHAAAARILGEVVDILPIPGRDGRGRPSSFPAAEVHARRGAALARLHRHGEAALSFRLAALVGRTLDPRAPREEVAAWLLGQAKAAREAGRLLEARAAARDALATHPGNAEAAEFLRALGE